MEENKSWQEEATKLGIKFAFRKKEDVLKDIEDAKKMQSDTETTDEETNATETANDVKGSEEKIQKQKKMSFRDKMKHQLSNDVNRIKSHFLYRVRWNLMEDNTKLDFLKKTISSYPFGWGIHNNKIRVYLSKTKKSYITSEPL